MGVILLVRHGQASWGAADYDALSERGHEQARLLGRGLAARGIIPTTVVHGGMRRHRETWEGMAEGAGWSLEPEIDQGWAEFDHVDVGAQVPMPPLERGEELTPREVQRWVEASNDRWVAAADDPAGDYIESFSTFTQRVDEAVVRTPREGTVIVVTSGGPIALTASGLLSEGGQSRSDLWSRMHVLCVNTGVTRLISGSRGLSLVTFNEDTHFDPQPAMRTYR
ncbi:MAG TPA: histidine phosphatase family protein [Marmoricola sp.]|nr:histidine phosphatase family protein [Marmoricola sp.]